MKTYKCNITTCSIIEFTSNTKEIMCPSCTDFDITELKPDRNLNHLITKNAHINLLYIHIDNLEKQIEKLKNLIFISTPAPPTD